MTRPARVVLAVAVTVVLLATFLLSGCASNDFQSLLNDVKANCHTQIDAQVSATMTGLGGQGHFTQECWPEGTAPMTVNHAVTPPANG